MFNDRSNCSLEDVALIVNTVRETKEQSVFANSVRRIQYLSSADFSFSTNLLDGVPSSDYVRTPIITRTWNMQCKLKHRSIVQKGINAVLSLLDRRTADFQTYRAQLLFNRDLKCLSDVRHGI
ncbi:hypothetical protein K0M31_016142 [Melipona bicolor]|uniref:Uncharacterized protein n=1 Tax=Melipona bicolor TaxID=60889 RepID=A0AA40KTA9_9HYME|nr:hypothetical protein K0M31_016142 [Melipona bicolor]